MTAPDELLAVIRAGFSRTTRPSDPFLIGSREGDAEDVVSAFFGIQQWDGLDAPFLDRLYDALSFFSEAGFRFFLPAYLVADVRGELVTADPVIHLSHSFHDITVETTAGGQTFKRRLGPRVLLNPRRYGAMRWADHARFRFAVFTREECVAIVAYLRFERDRDGGIDRPAIDAALDAFWIERTATAPTADDLEQHLREEERFVRAIKPDP
jgi:hypothetical protein